MVALLKRGIRTITASIAGKSLWKVEVTPRYLQTLCAFHALSRASDCQPIAHVVKLKQVELRGLKFLRAALFCRRFRARSFRVQLLGRHNVVYSRLDQWRGASARLAARSPRGATLLPLRRAA
jgi:hypothetical protein